jgi:hypothetical protein
MIDVEGGHQAWRTPDAGEAHGEKKKEGRAHNHSHAHGHVHSLARDLAAGHDGCCEHGEGDNDGTNNAQLGNHGHGHDEKPEDVSWSFLDLWQRQ